MVTNSSAGVVSRHDFMPFGESLGSGIGGRTTGAGFGIADGLREQFTSKERDIETGLDYFTSRYFASAKGRFTSADSLVGSLMNPQTLNRYSYVGNNPTNFIDPTGHVRLDPPSKGDQSGYWSENPYADAMAWQDTNAIVSNADSAAANASDPDTSTDSQAQTVSEPQNPATEQGGPCDQAVASIFGGEDAIAAASGFEPTGFPDVWRNNQDRSTAGGPNPNQWGHLNGYSAHIYGSSPGTSDTTLYVPGNFSSYTRPSGNDSVATFYYK